MITGGYVHVRGRGIGAIHNTQEKNNEIIILPHHSLVVIQQ